MTADLFLEGKRYISVRRASQEIGYSQDYIGQLCRQKKIPAKLIGRTWFVDIEALSKHKGGLITSPSLQTEKSIEKSIDLGYPSLKFESETVVHLPKLKKRRPNPLDSFKLHKDPSVLALSLAVTLFVVSRAVVSWVDFVQPQIFSPIDTSDSLALTHEVTNDQPILGDGLVVFPDSENREVITGNIKNSFSDEVEIFFDEGGESGVIRPVFRSQDNSDNYAFVMVPVREKQ